MAGLLGSSGARLPGRSHLAPNRRPQNTPYWLLWSTGIVAFVLCIVAFVLWGFGGASTLFDMIVAFCT